MPVQRYAVAQHPIEVLFGWIKSGEIAIPEIQRPFVWNAIKVRNLLDSLHRGYPIGYLITWKNADVKLKDGTTSMGKRILIDGQQRIVALMVALLGQEVVNKDYKRIRIRIAFHPGEDRFEVLNTAIRHDPQWIPDVSQVFKSDASVFGLVTNYCTKNPGTTPEDVSASIEHLKSIVSSQIGVIDLDSNLDIDTVTEIFIRVNSEGIRLGQSDFAMSKIAANEAQGGHMLRKAIDYCCHLAANPAFYTTMQQDAEFANTDYMAKMSWLHHENGDLYIPSYTDMLRVAFTSEFRRGRLEDLVALLSGRNFETQEYEEIVVEDSFARLGQGVLNFMNENHYKQLLMIIRSAGFVSSSLIRSQNTLNFAYILYLTLRAQNVPHADTERYVRRWFVMSLLTGRYSGQTETRIDFDIRQIDERGIEDYADAVFRSELSDAYWEAGLPQALNTSRSTSPSFCTFRAAQVKMNDLGFLSHDITVSDLVAIKSDVHHIFPRAFLKKAGLSQVQYNQVANFVVAQSEINIAIGSKAPNVYFAELFSQVRGGIKRYGNITDENELRSNFEQNCIPADIEHMMVDDYPVFLDERRRLMAQKIKEYFQAL